MKFISDNGPLEACQKVGIAGACLELGFAPIPKEDPLMAGKLTETRPTLDDSAFTGASVPMPSTVA